MSHSVPTRSLRFAGTMVAVALSCLILSAGALAGTQTVRTRIPAPPGCTRIPAASGSYGMWLRDLPLRPGCPDVHLYDGREKVNQNAHYAVLDMDIGSHDLQQCADAVIRLRAEYLFSAHCGNDLQFRFTSGDVARWAEWRDGMRPRVSDDRVSWVHAADPDASYSNFRRYLDSVFTYAGSASLSGELVSVPNCARPEIGDVFIEGGFPGHAVIVIDVAENPSGERVFLLAQSYMPAQDIHILRSYDDIDPWYRARPAGILKTPEWDFLHQDLKRFEPTSCEREASGAQSSEMGSEGGASEGNGVPEEGTTQVLLTTYTRFAAQSDTAGWRGLFRAVPDSVTPAESGFIRAALDSIEGIHGSSLDRTDCDRWQMWQLARCKMELASADYDGAVLRHTALMDERLSCFDSQSFWWSLVESRMEQLERARRFDDVLALIESAERTFPSGPARFMRGWASRIRYSLGLTEWEKESEGVMHARISELSGRASVAWEFAAHGGRVDTIFVSSTIVLRAGGRIWTSGGRRHCFDLADEPTSVPTESDSGRLTGCTLEPGDSVRVYLSAGGSPALIEILGK